MDLHDAVTSWRLHGCVKEFALLSFLFVDKVNELATESTGIPSRIVFEAYSGGSLAQSAQHIVIHFVDGDASALQTLDDVLTGDT